MPYSDVEKQREARAASARRRRAAVPQGDVEPDAMAVQPTRADLREAGRILGIGRGDNESDESYHARIQQSWRDFLLVVEP